MKNFKKSLVSSPFPPSSHLISFSQLRGKDSNSSKNKPPQQPSAQSSTSASSSTLPLQPSTSGQASLPNSSGHNGSSHSLASQAASQSSRSSAQSAPPQDRRLAVERATPAPPIVVVSPDNSDQSSAGYGSPERLSIGLEPGGSATPPRTSPLNRLRGPKDTIPIVGKPPRKQRSSRFVVTEKVEIERLAPFMGLLYHLRTSINVSPPFRNPPKRAPSTFHKKVTPVSCPF
jgi:serine/threonine-protein phosphatase 2A regulatory subunit B'